MVPRSGFEDGDHAFLIDNDPVQVEDFADPWLDAFYLVAELRHVGKGECVYRLTEGDAAEQLTEAEAEVETDRC